MLFDAVKRLFGYGDQPRNEKETHTEVVPSVSINGSLIPYREPYLPDISEIESEIAQVHKIMEEQMRTMMNSFGFSFGNPFSSFGFDEINHGQFGPPLLPPEIPSYPQIPTEPQVIEPVLNPRDEVLKPQFRSKSAKEWKGEDEILDERLKNEGLGSIIDELRPSQDVHRKNNSLFDNFSPFFGGGPFGSGIFGSPSLPGPESGSVMSSSTVTIYSNVNGHKSVEKITRHPDGKIERTVITDDGNKE